MTDCKYWKDSWGKSFAGRCFAPDDVKTNAVNKWCKTPQTCPYLLKNRMNNQEILNSLNEKIKAAEEALLYLNQTKAGLERVIANSAKPETLWEKFYAAKWSDSACDEFCEIVEQWLPKEQSAKGSQNVYVECTVEGFNDCLNQIKSKLR